MALFVSVAATFYFFGDKISEKVDEIMPTEEKMVEMMKEMQAQAEAQQQQMMMWTDIIK